MKYLRELIVYASLLIGGGMNYCYSQSVVINELMQSNIDYLMVDKDYPDSWVELYNGTEKDVNIRNWYIGLEADYTTGYKIPQNTIIPAGGHLVIYCDKEAKGLHTNFRLESGKGGSIYLFSSSKNLVDSKVNMAKMPAANVAYGRVTDGAEEWQYEVTATAGASNNSVGAKNVLPNPIFSVEGGVLNSPVALTISIPEGDYPDDTKLYVTLDGSEPTVNSSSYSNAFSMDIASTTVVRAKLISAEALPQRSVTHSYIFHPRNTNLPIISIATEDANLYSDDYGILSDFEQDGVINYKQEWRRPINAEYFDMRNGGATIFNQVGETAVGGNYSRMHAQKSLKLYANKRFGVKRYTSNFWDDKPNVSECKSFMLRNGGSGCYRARFNDAYVQKIFGTHIENLDWQAYQPVIVYINGVYKGEFGMRERSNEDYVAANYNGLEDIEVATYAPNKASSQNTLFQQFNDVYSNDNATFEQLAEIMDVENYANTMIAETYGTNIDFRGNNVSMWRPLAVGGKWRWILKDMDCMTGAGDRVASYNMFNFMYNSEYESLRLYKKMISFPEFRSLFVDLYSTYLGDFLKPEYGLNIIQTMYDEINDEIAPTFEVYNFSVYDYNYFVKRLRTFVQDRAMCEYQNMADFFNLGSVIPMTLVANGMDVKINNVGLTEGDFDGAYFSDRQLNLNSGAANCGWKMTVTHKDGTTEEHDFEDSEINILLSNYYSDEDDEIKVAFQTLEYGPTEFEERIADLGINLSDISDQSESLAPVFDEPQCAYINIVSESGLPTSSSEKLDAYVDFYDNNGGYMRKDIVLTQQGSDANNAEKKNLSVTFKPQSADDMDVVFGSWVPQNEYLLKAFYNDGLRGTAEIAYELYDQIMGISEGARMTGDAFPCVVYVNGNFEGVYAWQLKKHRKNMGLAKDDPKQVWLDGTLNDKQLFAPEASINWTKFEVRNPKDLYNMDGTDYDGDNPQELLDETSAAYTAKKKQVRCAEAKSHIIALSHYSSELMNLETDGATFEEMRNAIAERFDVDNLVKYMVFSLATNNYDGFSKKWQWYTMDGQHWAVAPYDCELTFGYNDDDVTKLWTADKSSKKYDYKMENTTKDGPMQWIKRYFWEDVKSEWMAQRSKGIISVENIMSIVNSWSDRIESDDYANEWSKWSESPVADNAERIDTWVTQRLALEDEYLGYTTYDLIVTSAEWATICVPFAFEVPENMSVYSADGILEDGKTLAMTNTNKPEANKPYLVHANEGTYNLSGVKVDADEEADDYLCNGYMVGSYSDIYVPKDDYVLQNQATGVGFYRVTDDNQIRLKANRAYISKAILPVAYKASSSLRISIENYTDITDFVFDVNSEIESIYSVNGIKKNLLTPGLNIVKQKNGKISKVVK